MAESIPMYIVAGFLGSGKTSFLNTILRTAGGKRAGVIVNDFGSVNIDASLVHRDAGITIRELNNGQIFCSCLSGSFADAVASFADSGVDLLLVESSGLSKPSALREVLSLAAMRHGGAFRYGGMICLVDASRFLPLSRAVNAVTEQVVYSDILVINKTDLVDVDTLRAVRESLLSLKPGVRILETSFGNVPPEVLSGLEAASGDAREPEGSGDFVGWCEGGRPYACTLYLDAEVSEPALKEFLAEISPDTYRIKGYVRTGKGDRYVDGIGGRVEIREAQTWNQEARLAIISRIGKDLEGRIDSARRRILGAFPCRVGA